MKAIIKEYFLRNLDEVNINELKEIIPEVTEEDIKEVQDLVDQVSKDTKPYKPTEKEKLISLYADLIVRNVDISIRLSEGNSATAEEILSLFYENRIQYSDELVMELGKIYNPDFLKITFQVSPNKECYAVGNTIYVSSNRVLNDDLSSLGILAWRHLLCNTKGTLMHYRMRLCKYMLSYLTDDKAFTDLIGMMYKFEHKSVSDLCVDFLVHQVDRIAIMQEIGVFPYLSPNGTIIFIPRYDARRLGVANSGEILAHAIISNNLQSLYIDN